MLKEDRAEQERSKRAALVKKTINPGQDRTSALSSDSDGERHACDEEQQERSRRSALVKRRTKLSGDSTSTLSSDDNADRIECEKGQVERSKQSAGVKRRTKRRNDRASILSSDQEADRKIREKGKESARSIHSTITRTAITGQMQKTSPRTNISPVKTLIKVELVFR